MSADPFTAASPLYRAAMAQPHKSGAAFQVFARKRPIVSFLTSWFKRKE